MNLDLHTLFLVTIYVEAILGLLLLFAWIQNAEIRAVAWWGSAHLMRAGSVVLFGLYGSVIEAVSIDLANALLFLAFAVTWTGARVFDGRKPLPLAIVAGPAAVADRVPSAGHRRVDGESASCSPPESSRPTPGSRPMSSGAAAPSRWYRAGRRSSCCSRTAHCSCCARRSPPCCHGRRPASIRERVADGA